MNMRISLSPNKVSATALSRLSKADESDLGGLKKSIRKYCPKTILFSDHVVTDILNGFLLFIDV